MKGLDITSVARYQKRLRPLTGATAVRMLKVCLPSCPVACSGGANRKEEPGTVEEIYPGILQGYLPMDDPLAGFDLGPPAPEPDSPLQGVDDRVVKKMRPLRRTSADSDLSTEPGLRGRDSG